MNELPYSWTWTILNDIGEIVAGGTPSTKVPAYFDGKIAWITPADLTGYNQKYIYQGRRNISVEGLRNSSAQLIPCGSILFSSRAPIGYVAIAANDLCTNQGFKNLVPSAKVHSEFVYYYLKSAKQLAEKNASGTTFKEISARNFAKLPIPLPPLSEQKKIVLKIEALFSELDSGVASLKSAKEQIRLYRQAMLAAAFSGKLIKDKPLNGIQELNDNLNPIQVSHNYSKVAEPKLGYGNNELPEGWRKLTVKDICEKIVGGGTPSTKIGRYWKGDINWITSADIIGIKDVRPRKKITKEAINNSATNSVPKGTIIIVTRVGLGKVAIAPYEICFSQDCQGLMLKKEIVTANYALWFLSKATEEFKYKNRGTTINGVTKKQLADLIFYLPPVNQQTQIVEEIEKRFSEADNLEKAIDESLEKAETLRQSILKKAFEGRLL